jgi:excisionase family DNA binding protein
MTTHDNIAFCHLRFSVSEAASHMRISRALIYKLIARGSLIPSKIGNRTIISGAEIERLMQTTSR